MPAWLLALFSRYGYTAVFAGVMLENAGVPVPGETVLLAGAALAHADVLSLPWVVLTAVGAAIAGDNCGFLVGRRGGRRLAESWGPTLGLTEGRLAAFDRFFDRHGPKTVFMARFVTGLRVFGALVAGASDLPWTVFLVYNAAGAVAWSLAIAAAGYWLAESWQTLERWVGRLGMIGLVGFIAILIAGTVRAGRINR